MKGLFDNRTPMGLAMWQLSYVLIFVALFTLLNPFLGEPIFDMHRDRVLYVGLPIIFGIQWIVLLAKRRQSN